MKETYLRPRADVSRWTFFYDMSSGGEQKTKYKSILIHAPKEEAAQIFQSKFNRDPNNTTCRCCGSDFDIEEGFYDELISRWGIDAEKENVLVLEVN